MPHPVRCIYFMVAELRYGLNGGNKLRVVVLALKQIVAHYKEGARLREEVN